MTDFHLKFFLYAFIWISILLSIGVPPHDIFKFGDSFVNSFNSIRIGFSLLACITLITYYILVNFKKKKTEVFKKKFTIFFLFLTYFIFQIIGLVLKNYSIKSLNLDNTYLVILGSGAIITLFLIDKTKSKNLIRNTVYLTLFVISMAGLILLFTHIKNSGFQHMNYFSLYNSVPPDKQIFINHELPRVTGISRTLSILNISLFCLFVFFKKNKYKYIFLTLNIVIGLIIFGFQSRGTILCYVSTITFFLLISKKINLTNKIKFFFIICIIPFILFESIRYLTLKTITPELPFKYKPESSMNILIEKNRLLQDKSSSGRYNLWAQAIQNYDKKKLFGYGPQADRFLLNENLKKSFSDNVSNAYIYAFLCGGYFGLISFLLLVVGILILISKKIFKENLFDHSHMYIEKISLLFLIFFLIRSIFENSFAVFGIDFIMVIISIFILSYRTKNMSIER
jgi:O-antigen ligase